MATKNIIAFVSAIPAGTIKSIRAYEEKHGETFRIMLIENALRNRGKTLKDYPGLDILVEVDMSDPQDIARELLPYQDDMVAITSRNESFMSDFIAVIPNVPYLKTPSSESLLWAVDKVHMRRRFTAFDKKITPKYALVADASDEERERVIKKIGFPMIVKPANLAQSMLVAICYHEDELKKTLAFNFENIQRVYDENGRHEKPKIIAEEYMEGLMYSVDAYVSERGKIYFCPLVRVKTGKDIGHQDFYGYLQMTPTKLLPKTIKHVHDVATKGVHALSLRNTTVHIELLRVDDTWKIIEIGARIGGFRHKLHSLTHGIDHAMNDILIRMGRTPVIPKTQKQFAAALKWYPKDEGVITKITGLKKVRELSSFQSILQHLKKGDTTRFAMNGGLSVFNLILANTSRAELLADIRRIEEYVVVEVEKFKKTHSKLK